MSGEELTISAELLKAYLFGTNVVPNTKEMDYFTQQVAHQLAAIPPQIRIGPSTIPGNRYGVYSTVWIGEGTEMGPFIGHVIQPDMVDWTRHNDMMWEVLSDSGSVLHFVDASPMPPAQQSWLSLVGMARSDREQNLVVTQIGRDVYYRASKSIPPGTELLVWYSNNVSMYMGIPGIEPTTKHTSNESRDQKTATGEPVAPPRDARLNCVICRRGFNSRSNLRSHMRIHTLEKPFLCKYCHRSFSQSSTLRNHTRLHTGEKPYRCTICQSAYSQLAGLRAHQKSARHRPKHTEESDEIIIAV